MTIRRKMKWKITHRKINGRRRKVKIHRKRVLDGYLVRVVRKRKHSYVRGRIAKRHHRRIVRSGGFANAIKMFGGRGGSFQMSL